MVLFRRALWVILTVLGAFASTAARAEDVYEGGRLFDEAVRTLRRQLPSQRTALAEAAEAWRVRARAAGSLAAERAVLFEFLARIPASHLTLLSNYAHGALLSDMNVRERVGLGLDVIRLRDGYFVAGVVPGSPAEGAGVLRGDRLLEIDGEDVEASGRLDLRTDDAHLPDPPAHLVLCPSGRSVRLGLKRAPDGEVIEVVVAPAAYRLLDLDRAAVRMVGDAGVRIGVVPISLMYRKGAGTLVQEALDGALSDADAVVFDVRGHGGLAHAVRQIVAALRADVQKRGRPFVFLADARTRSAKEILLQRIRRAGLGTIVGERTAGAVRPCGFFRLGPDTWLMCPVQDLDERFSLELVGLEPDVAVSSQVPYAEGLDPIFEFGVLVALEEIGAAVFR